MTKFAIYFEDDPNSRFVMQYSIFKKYLPEFELQIFDSTHNYKTLLSNLNTSPQLAILDIYLGNCPTGDQVLYWMRQQPTFQKTIIVAFTADSTLEAQSLLDAGFDAVIHKPQDNSQHMAHLLTKALNGEHFKS